MWTKRVAVGLAACLSLVPLPVAAKGALVPRLDVKPGCYSWGGPLATSARPVNRLTATALYSTACTKAHHLQVFAVITVPGFSATRTLRARDAAANCARAYGAFTGTAPPRPGLSVQQQKRTPYLHWMTAKDSTEARKYPGRLVCSFFRGDPAASTMKPWTGSMRTSAATPSSREIYRFGPDVDARDQDAIRRWTAQSVVLQEIMFGRRMSSFTTLASKDVQWLAQEDCRTRPPGMPDCVGTVAEVYKDVWAMGGCYPAPADNGCFDIASLGNFRWDDPTNNAKTFAHEVHHVFQQQVVPEYWRSTMVPSSTVRSTGPLWLWEGAAEWVGWRIVIDLRATTYRTKRADWEAIARTIDRPLRDFETLAASDSVVNAYQFYVLALDELLMQAPDGPAALYTFYSDIAQGTQWERAFERAFGTSVEDFYRRFEASRPR